MASDQAPGMPKARLRGEKSLAFDGAIIDAAFPARKDFSAPIRGVLGAPAGHHAQHA